MDDPLLNETRSKGAQDTRSPRLPRSPVSASQKAIARGRTYALFRHLYLHGLTEDTLSYTKAIPELAAVLPQQFEADEAAADHHHLFGFNVFPYQSIFLDPAGLLGGDLSETVVHAYQMASFNPDLAREGADHIGYELGFLAFLCGAESDAREDELPEVIRNVEALQREFLDAHLLPWLLPFGLAVERQNHPFYAALATLTMDFVGAHRSDLGTDTKGGSPADFRLPSPPDLLSDQGTSLKDIVAYLLTPVYCGIHLSRDDIGRLARARRLPSGFGGRQQMLLNLLRSAATYDGLDSLLAALQEVASEWATAYGGFAEQPAPFTLAREWQARAEATESLLGEMSDRISMGDLPNSGN